MVQRWLKVKSKAKSNIEILGYQSNEVMLEYMQKAKAFVLRPKRTSVLPPLKLKPAVHL